MRRNHRALTSIACLLVVLLAAVGAVAGTIGWAVRDREAREAALAQEATLALKDARRLLAQGHYSEAQSAAKRANALNAGSVGLREQVREVCDDLDMAMRLEEIRLPRAFGGAEVVYDDAAADVAYAEAFRGYGVDVDRLEPAQAAEAIRGKAIQLELTVALDCWARKRRNLKQVAEQHWKRLIAVARAADPDEWRNQVRDALEARNTASLAALARSPKLEGLPLQTLSLLGEAVQDAAASVTVLRHAQRRFPDDFWINFQLGWSLEHMTPPHQVEAIRFYTTARALRPRHAPIHVFLGNALLRRGELDEAIAEYHKSLELQPGYAAAHNNLGAALSAKGRLDDAITAHREAIRHQPQFPQAHLHLGSIFNKLGQWDQAIFHSTRAIELRGSEALARSYRGQAYLGIGQWDKAAADLGTGVPSESIDDLWTKFACLRLLVGDTPGYQELCSQLSKRMESNQSPGPAYIASRVCSLSPKSPVPSSQAVRWADVNVASGKAAWNMHALALARYRAGEFEQAIQHSEESLKVRPDWRGTMLNWLVLALAHHQAGRSQEAVQWLAKAVEWRDKLSRAADGAAACPPAMHIQDWLEFQVLLHEAEPLVLGKSP